ncbi:hypothetical protein B0H14DRAFT_3426866 [Mycena olivaceomarginata]|nr:hypothetical protein B0H14DRAFT_3426866 [Mycena olivaceomarginata]
MATPYPGILLCAPQYAPDPGHEDQYKHPGPFYAVVCKDWWGVVTSKESRSRMLERYPNAYTWEASPWWTFDRRWTLDCTEYHEHEGEHPVADEPIHPATPDSGEPSSPSTLLESTTLACTLTHTTIHHGRARPSCELQARSWAHQLSALTQQFIRVLGPQAVVPGKPPIALPAKRKTTLFAHEVATALHAGGKIILTAEGPAIVMPQDDLGSKWCKEVEGLVEEWTQENRTQGPTAVMYAVSGKRHIFQNWDHAVAVLKRSPGAELLFTKDEDELFEFLAEDLEETLEA